MNQEMTDGEFEAGLRAVLGDHFQDLTRSHPQQGNEKQREQRWEWACWCAVYGSILVLFLRWL